MVKGVLPGSESPLQSCEGINEGEESGWGTGRRPGMAIFHRRHGAPSATPPLSVQLSTTTLGTRTSCQFRKTLPKAGCMWGAQYDTLTDFLMPVRSSAVWNDGNGFGARDLGWKRSPSTAHLNDLGQVLYCEFPHLCLKASTPYSQGCFE